ncbi:sulfatase family protein [Pontiella sulfatireligans]|uniref:Arylsulfatase n=1 Tax=Pontiella sulfatireligans TaxID=2750658 RepID=A0A6C2UEK4_9BACT|nr:arylsulfatase [Pontiella sulfatireligans]SPS74149.1 sulfatase S1_15 [Kiritimatiellales bacterium]VGO18303.1 Arylsulfatase [Pontiella sulfatireligans]
MKMSLISIIALSIGLSASAVQRPNVLIIYTDDQGYGDVSYLNPDSKFQTPNMDRLAHEGINFSHGHSSSSACTPSRYALLTGRYSWRTTLKVGVGNVDEPCMIEEGRMTLGSMLQEKGYNTACVGKWHLGMDLPGTKGKRDWSQPIMDGPLDHGFDYWYGLPTSPKSVCAWFENRGLEPGAAEPTLWTYHKKNLPNIDKRWRIMKPYYKSLDDQPPETIQSKSKVTEVAPDWNDDELLTRYTDKAIQWLGDKIADAKSDKPFFLYFALTSPHEPVAPRADFIGKSDCSGYGDFVLETDYHIGRLLDYLDEAGLTENTLVLFSSDNGPENPWKERIKEQGHYSSGPLRDGKRSHYEGGHRVPFAVRWPAGIKQPGRVWDKPVSQSDMLATLAEIVGAKIPEDSGEDSQSFADVFSNPASGFERLPFIGTNNRSGQFSITEGKWKLVLPNAKKGAELYDLTADIGEKNNLVKQHPEVAKKLEAKMTDILCNGRTTPGVRQSNDTGWWPAVTWMTPEEYKAKHPEGELVGASKKEKQNKEKKSGKKSKKKS